MDVCKMWFIRLFSLIRVATSILHMWDIIIDVFKNEIFISFSFFPAILFTYQNCVYLIKSPKLHEQQNSIKKRKTNPNSMLKIKMTLSTMNVYIYYIKLFLRIYSICGLNNKLQPNDVYFFFLQYYLIHSYNTRF